jgi:putative ABC transport system permease protein
MPEWTSYIRPHLAAVRLEPGREAEILDEISQHLDARYQELLADGATEAEAERLVAEELCVPDALAAFMRPLRQAHVPAPLAPGTPDRGLFRGFLQDLRIAFRSMKKAPYFATAAILTLALAIGANTAIFSVIQTVLIAPLAFPESDRLVSLLGSAPGSEVSGTFGLGTEFYVEYQENAKTLEDLAFYATLQTTMRADDHVERLFMATATPTLFSTLGVEPVIGRLPTEKDEEGKVVVISHSLWRTWFGDDPSVLGRTFDISNAQRTVIGVMGPGFHFPQENTAVWIHDLVGEPGNFNLNMVGRMAPGADHESLKAELATLARRLPERFGSTARYSRIIEHYRPEVRSLEQDLVGNLKEPLWILMGTAGIVLLIACANVANLLIVRAETRRRETAVRCALGAARLALMRSQMSEAILLAAFGGVGGVLLAWAGVPLIVRLAPEGIPGLSSVGVNGTALLFTAGVAMIAALASGFLPAIRFSNLEIMSGLRNSIRVGSGPNHRMRNALVVVQTAAALVLLVGSGVLFQSFLKLRSVDPGFDTENIFTFQMAPDPRQHPTVVDGPTVAQFHYAFMDRLAALPGVESVGLVNTLPLDEGAPFRSFSTEPTEGAEPAEHRLGATFADGDYFRTMGIGLLSGSTFARNSTPGGTVGAIVSHSAAQQLWPGEAALGKRLRPSSTPDEWMTVIGVVEDVMLDNFRQEKPEPLVYLPMVGHTAKSWTVGTPAFVVKSPRAATIAADIRALLREVAPGAPMYRVFTMSSLAARTMATLSFMMLTLALAAGLALVLGAVGIYGTLSYMVSQRTREIGIRMALGAQSGEVRRMIVSHGSGVALIGVAIGIAAAILLTRLLEVRTLLWKDILFRVAASDWQLTYVSVSAVMVAVALLASYIPARRASSVDPIVSLRAE